MCMYIYIYIYIHTYFRRIGNDPPLVDPPHF